MGRQPSSRQWWHLVGSIRSSYCWRLIRIRTRQLNGIYNTNGAISLTGSGSSSGLTGVTLTDVSLNAGTSATIGGAGVKINTTGLQPQQPVITYRTPSMISGTNGVTVGNSQQFSVGQNLSITAGAGQAARLISNFRLPCWVARNKRSYFRFFW